MPPAARGSILIAGLIIAPQIVITAPWVGYHLEARGRKPLLLVGVGLVAVRTVAFAFVNDYPYMIAIQLLDGVSGSIISVLTVLLVIADLAAGSGRFNLAQGIIGALMGVAASAAGTSVTGLIFQYFGRPAGCLFTAAVAAAATAFTWFAIPETKLGKYE